MVAKIAILKRLLDALNYNEQKVQKGKAECIGAVNYLLDAREMNFYQKLERLENLNALNERATTKTLHVSLNFDVTENLSNDLLNSIASSYMEQIGFGNQPYLVYQHLDAGHPHIHIVSSTIQNDGSRINTHNIGKERSEKARKQIEQTFNLVKAQKHALKDASHAVLPTKLIYGKSDTKRSISNVVNAVINSYRFTSLPEFNAVLRQFNVIADRGREQGRIFKNRGLMYRILDDTGAPAGVPIKASLLSGKPTLNSVEKRFTANETLRKPFVNSLKNEIDNCLCQRPKNVRELSALLQHEQIATLLRQNADGRIYGITFVDHKSKCVFNGSDLGKSYSIAALQKRMSNTATEATADTSASAKDISTEASDKKMNQEIQVGELLHAVIDPKQNHEGLPFELKKKKRRKRNNDSN